MELDSQHQELKYQLMAVFDRASRSVDSTTISVKKTKNAIDNDKNGESKLFKLTGRINGKLQEVEEPPQPPKDGDDEELTE